MDDSVIIRFPFIHGWVVWIYDMNESSSSQEAPLHFSRTGALNLAQFVHDRLGGRPGIYAMFFHQKKRPFDAGTWWSRSRSGQFFQTNPFDMLTLPKKNDGKWMVWCCTSSKKISRGIAECWAWSLDLAILFLSTSSCKEWLCAGHQLGVPV